MDELEILKKDWKKKESSFNQISENQIYAMLHKKSSSIVKWIFVISIAEFLLLRLLDLSIFTDEDYINWMKSFHVLKFEQILTGLNFLVLLFFIFLFYKNFKKINAAVSIKQLMADILKTRKIVQLYVWYNLALIAVSSVVIMLSQWNYNPQLSEAFEQYKTAFIIGSIIFALVMVLIFWLFYKLLYGILLKRLYNNYKELKKIDL